MRRTTMTLLAVVSAIASFGPLQYSPTWQTASMFALALAAFGIRSELSSHQYNPPPLDPYMEAAEREVAELLGETPPKPHLPPLKELREGQVTPIPEFHR